MLTAALRDLQWRKRRFVIAIVGTGLVFAMTLVLTGLANGSGRRPPERWTPCVDAFLVKPGATGPFLGSSAFPATAAGPGVSIAVPLVYGSATMPEGSSARSVNVFGAPNAGPGCPSGGGPSPSEPHEAAVSSTMDRPIGATIEVGLRNLQVVGTVDDSTALAGQPNIFLTVAGAQTLLFSGQSLILHQGDRPADRAPTGFKLVNRPGPSTTCSARSAAPARP